MKADLEILYKDKNQIAYKKNGVRYAVTYGGGRVQVTEMSADGQLVDYVFELDDAISALSNGPEQELALDFVRRLKRKRGSQLLWSSVFVLLKLISHMIVAAIVAFAAGVIVQKFWRIL